MYFKFAYRPYGGGALGLAPSEVDRLDWATLDHLLVRLGEEREKEAAAIKKANRSRSTGAGRGAHRSVRRR